MNIRTNPIPPGFNKHKLKIAFAAVIFILAGIFLWALQYSPVSDSKASAAARENIVRNDNTNADVNDIINTVSSSKTGSSATLGDTKHNSSDAETQQVAVANQQAALQAANDLKAAMRAPITQLTPTASNGGGSGGTQSSSPTGTQDSSLPKDDQNMTSEKRDFIKAQSQLSEGNVLSTSVNSPVSKLVLAMGTKIPSLLDQEINSDLPGQIYGHVARDVYDSRTHSNILIPAGSNLVGTYDSAIAYGQERLLVAWKRVNFPNGQWLDIQGMGGAGADGAGFADKVDNHYDKIVGATALISILAAGAQLSQPQQSNVLQAPGIGQTMAQSAGTSITQVGTSIVQKDLNLQPTLHIRPGYEFSVEVTRDIRFPNAYTGNSNKN